MSILIGSQTRILIQGITGREGAMIARHSIDYGTAICAGVTPGKEGETIWGIPVYDTVRKAVDTHGANTSVIVVPPPFALDAALEAIGSGMKLVVVTTENIPQMDVVKLLHIARQEGVRVIGPNTVGMINPRHRIKVGSIGGDRPERCFVPGAVGVISRSGGMTAETSWMVKKAGFGVSTSIGIGGDRLIGTNIKELLHLFEQDAETAAVCLFSEPGTHFEEQAAEFIREGGFTKPLIAYISGRFTESMPEGTVFGHAGAVIAGGAGKPSVKMHLLKLAGACVLDRYDDLIAELRTILSKY